MPWPYAFLDLTPSEKQQRRHSLDLYAAIAHYSAFIPVICFLAYRLIRRVERLWRALSGGVDYQQLPRSPVVKASRLSAAGGVAGAWAKLAWWLGDDVELVGWHVGRRDEWVFGGLWFVWLVMLCVLGTGRDYMHFTKRFGIIATSQLPIQYLLALKPLSPLAWVFRTSHEQLNRYHRVLGRIIYALVVLHAVFYHIFFFYQGVWLKRFFAPMVFCGVLAFAGFSALTGTAVTWIRKWSYRVFFIVHLVTALVVPPLLFFHAPPTRIYLFEALIIFLADLGVRRYTTLTAPTTIEAISGTSLLKISIALSPLKAGQFSNQPGSHVYLSIPPGSRPSTNPAAKSPIFEFLFNPFTVAGVDKDLNTLTLIARTRNGPVTKHLAHFPGIAPAAITKIPLAIEGPYGAMGKHFQALTAGGIDRTLLVAGGVGATFALPLYHALLAENPSARVQLIWAIRGAGDATWAVAASPPGKSPLDDDRVQLFLTGDMGMSDNTDNAAGGDGGEALELGSWPGSDRRQAALRQSNRRRPDFGKIVDDLFRQGGEEKVAVLVCGPAEMAREVRARVRPWAMKGRRVWWHNESFGW